MAVFVAGSDESGFGDGKGQFYFGGFVAPEKVWHESFAPQWKNRVLDTRPRLPYLHVTELKSKQWRKAHGIRDIVEQRKLDDAFRVICEHEDLFPVTAHLDAAHFRAAMERDKVQLVIRRPGGLARKPFEPDYHCFIRFALHVLLYVYTEHPTAEKVVFVIERNGRITDHIRRLHESIPKGLREKGRGELADLVGDLIPAGKDNGALQAADLLCWYTRNAHNLDVVDGRRFEQIAKRPGIRSYASEQFVDELAAAFKDDDAAADATNEGVIASYARLAFGAQEANGWPSIGAASGLGGAQRASYRSRRTDREP